MAENYYHLFSLRVDRTSAIIWRASIQRTTDAIYQRYIFLVISAAQYLDHRPARNSTFYETILRAINLFKESKFAFSSPTLKHSVCLRRQKQSRFRIKETESGIMTVDEIRHGPLAFVISLQNIQRRGSSCSRRNPGDVRLRQLMTVVRVIAPTVA